MAKDHYVSQVYLKQFHCNYGNNILHMVQKNNLNNGINIVSTKNVCYLIDGNRSSFLSNDMALEDFLKNLEPKLAFIFSNLLLRRTLSEEDFISLSYFIAYLYLVNPISRARAEQFHREMLKMTIKGEPELKNLTVPWHEMSLVDCIEKGIINIDIEKEYSLAVNCDCINNLSERLLMNSIWTFLYNQSKDEFFITSDNPVINKHYDSGFRAKFLLTITPRVALLIDVYKSKFIDVDKKDYLKAKYKFENVNKSQVKRINRDIVKHAYMQVFFSNNNQKSILNLVRDNQNYNLKLVINNLGPFVFFENKLVKNELENNCNNI